MKSFKIFISATEQSGDNIGFNILNELSKKNSNLIFDGVGGSKMSVFLKNKFFDLNDFNTMGIFEVFFSLKKFFKMINFLCEKILNENYDLIITIDSPDFNYPLAKKIKKKNNRIKIIHIVAPTVWAWRANRAKKFSNIFDELMVLYDFEKKYFTKYFLKTTHIGHPIYYIKTNTSNIHGNKIIAFLPGSRLSELKTLLPYYEMAYLFLLENHSNFTIFIPTLPHLSNVIKKFVVNWKLKVVLSTNSIEIEKYYSKTTCAIVCSGTATLEIAKRNIPQLIIYKFNIFTEFFLMLFVKVKFANIINIIDNKMIIPELTNSSLNKISFITEVNKLITNKKINDTQIDEINKRLKNINGNKPPYTMASDIINSYFC